MLIKPLNPSNESDAPVSVVSGGAINSASSTSTASTASTTGGRTVYFHGVPMKETDLLWKGLSKMYGIGPALAERVCQQFARTRYTKIMERRDSGRLSKIERWVADHFVFETERRRKEEAIMKRYVSTGSVRGIRMRQGRPVRGQRTSTNAKTAKRLNRARVGVGY